MRDRLEREAEQEKQTLRDKIVREQDMMEEVRKKQKLGYEEELEQKIQRLQKELKEEREQRNSIEEDMQRKFAVELKR